MFSIELESEPNNDFRREIVCEFSSSRGCRSVFWKGTTGVEFEEGEALLLRGARRRREKVCLRLPADSLKTERSILGVDTSAVSVRRRWGEEEQKERERSSDWERWRRSIRGRDSMCR